MTTGDARDSCSGVVSASSAACSTRDAGAGEATASVVEGRRFIGMFSYGSNNEKQLRARCKSPRLRGCPAYLDGYVRVFGYRAPQWGGGSVASVAPKEGGRVYGCFYVMTPEEVEILDLYEHVKEGGYLKQAVLVNVRLPRGRSAIGDGRGHVTSADGDVGVASASGVTGDVLSPAMTYVMSQGYVRDFVMPSPQYLTAVYRTLTSNFPELSGRLIEICDYTGSKRSEWAHPGSRALPLKAFLLEVGLNEEPPWMLPTVLGAIAGRLSKAGIVTTDDLCEAAIGGTLLSKLEAVNQETHSEEETTPDAAVASAAASAAAAATEATYDQTESAKTILAATTVPKFSENTVAVIVRLATARAS